MRIALVIEQFNPQGGGAERSTWQIAQELAGRGHDLTILTATRLLRPLVDSPVRICVCPGGKGTRTSLRLYRFAQWARRQLDTGPYDSSLSVTTAVPAAVLQPRGGTMRETFQRNVAIRPGAFQRASKRLLMALSPKKQMLLHLERQSLRDPRVRCIAAVSQYVRDQLRRHYNIDDSRIQIVPNAAAMPAMTPEQRIEARHRVRQGFGIPDDQVAYLFAALNPRLKGVTPLIHATHALVRRGLPVLLMLAGQNEYAQQRLAEQLGIRHHIRFIGPTNRMADLYCAADVTVLPTYYDPASKVIIESLMMGVPAISTAYNGASDFIQGNSRGPCGRVIAEPDDVPALAQAMADLADPNERTRCAQATQGLADDLSMRRHVDRLEQILLAAGSTK